MTEYSEIEALKQFKNQHGISLSFINAEKIEPHLTPVELIFHKNKITVQVEDEYDDLHIDSELLHLILVLREIETIDTSTDFLDWCHQLDLNASNHQLLVYYNEMTSKLSDFNKLFDDGKITSFITDLDFQLNAGGIQILRLNKNR